MNGGLADRTKAMALRMIRLYVAIPKNDLTRIIARQMLRSGTSVGAQCREAFRSRSTAELISKLESAMQEMDETLYWLELLAESETVAPARLKPLMVEVDQLIRITVASVLTIKNRRTG